MTDELIRRAFDVAQGSCAAVGRERPNAYDVLAALHRWHWIASRDDVEEACRRLGLSLAETTRS